MAPTKEWIRSIVNPMERTKARFMDKVEQLSNGCWHWSGAKDKDGYGTFQYAGGDGTLRREKRLAHRVAYDLFVGSVSGQLLVCHSCDCPSCVNPKHLFLGHTIDNVADRVKKGRSAFGERNGTKTCPDTVLVSGLKRRKKYPFMGEEMTLQDISALTSIPFRRLVSRVRVGGWDINRAVTVPLDRNWRVKSSGGLCVK